MSKEEIKQALTEIFSCYLLLEEISFVSTTPLKELLDSLDFLAASMDVEKTFNIDIPEADAYAIFNNDFANFVNYIYNFVNAEDENL